VIRGERTHLRPATPADTDLLHGWFADPEVHRFWGGSPKSRDEVEAKYVGGRSPAVESFIVERDGEPIGYIQHWSDAEGEGGLDMFLVPDARGQGLGPDAGRALAAYASEELGWKRVTVDPAIGNERAIKAWERAGFRTEREWPDHPDGPSLLMVWKRVHPWMEKLRELKARHKQRHRVFRVGAVVVGVLVILVGLALIPLPGPGWLVTAVGVFILALEFDRAERLLERILDRLEQVTDQAQKAGPLAKALMALAAIAGLAAFVAAIVLWDIPLLPG